VTDPSHRGRSPQQVPLAQPGASVPRWLAVVVLIALLASGALSTWLILAPGPDAEATPPAAAASD